MTAELLLLVGRGMLVASIALVAILALRGVARHLFGARIAYALWLIVPAAVIASYLPPRVVTMSAPAPEAATRVTPTLDQGVVVPVGSDIAIGTREPSLTPLIAPGLLALWLAGVALSLALVLIDQRRIVRRLGLSRDDGFYRANGDGAGPAVVGILIPRVVVPADFEERYDPLERTLVLAHERAHIRTGDAQVNALAAFAQCLNWFNPLFYIARKALRIDQELACDERVMRRHGAARRAYAEAMLKTQLASRALPLGCHWPALGARPLKQRIAMLTRRQPGRIMRLAGGAACLGLVGTGGVAAWAAQPAAVQYERPAQRNADATLGAELVETIKDGRTDAARALIRAGADVNHVVLGDGSPLIAAVRDGDLELVRLLITRGADVNRAVPGDGSPLIAAAGEGEPETVAMLIRAGADVNLYVRGDETPLINAARENRLAAAGLLLDNGADPNLEVEAPTLRSLGGIVRRSPLSVATEGGHDEMIRLLRRRGARA